MGSPNLPFKQFATNKLISEISKTNTIYLYDMNGKVRTLSQTYFPKYEHIKSLFLEINKPKYLIIDKNILDGYLLKSNELKAYTYDSYNNWLFVKIE